MADATVTAGTIVPRRGDGFTDACGRVLVVHLVDLLDPQGSQVKGRLYDARESVPQHEPNELPGGGSAFSTTLATWKHIWHDKAPRAEKQKGWLG